MAQDGIQLSGRLRDRPSITPRNSPCAICGPASTDHLGLVEADDGFSQNVIVRVALAADGRLNTRLGEPLGVTGRDVLHAAIAVMHQCIFWV